MAPLLTQQSVTKGSFYASVGGIAPQLTSLFCIVDALAPQVFAPLLHLTMRGADVALPGAAAQEGMPELSAVLKHFQDHVAAITNEALEGDGTGAATGEAIAVCNVAVVGQLAAAAAVGTSGRFVSGDHDGQEVVEALAPDDRTIQHDEARPLGPRFWLHKALQKSVPVVDALAASVPNAHGALQFTVPQPFLPIVVFLDAEALDGLFYHFTAVAIGTVLKDQLGCAGEVGHCMATFRALVFFKAFDLLHPGGLLSAAHHYIEIHDGHGIAP